MADNLNLPPSISGDGRTFVSALKKILGNVDNVITDTIEPIVNPMINTNTPTAPTNFTVEFDKDGVLWRWDYSDNINIDFFELRTDDNPGNEVNLVDRVRTTQSTGVPGLRSGTMYLYARWINGHYSIPVTIQYNKAIPPAPTAVTITNIFQGFVISCDPIPDTCNGVQFRINGADFFSPNNNFTYNATMGTFIIKAAFTDVFGPGIFSAEQTVTLIEKIDEQMLADEAVSLAKVDAVLQDAVAKARQSTVDIASLTTTVNNLEVIATGTHDSAAAVILELGKDPFSTDPPSYSVFTSIKNTVNGLQSSVTADIGTINGTLTTHTSQISQNAGSITNVVAELNKDPFGIAPPTYTSFSKIKQTTDSISNTVATKASAADLTITNNNITSMVAKLNSAPNSTGQYSAISTLKQQADSISSTVTLNKNSADNSISSINNTLTTVQSNITQNANNITAVVGELNKDPYGATPPTYTAFSRIKATTDSISSTVVNKANVSDLTVTNNNITGIVAKLNSEPNATGQYSAISSLKQQADSISSTVTSNSTDISNLTQQANSISSTVTSNKASTDASIAGINSSITGMQSSITQNASNITSIVTNLGKSPAQSGYSAITQLSDAVNLKVDKNGVISQINLSPEVITIDGAKLHVTGATTFDNGVIVTRMLGDQQVVGTKIKDGDITTNKIGANQITGVHIVGNAVTGDHIEAGSEIRTPVLIGGTIKGARIQNTDNTAYIDSDGTVSGVNIIGSTVSGGTVSGATITGGTIIGARIQNETNTAYIDSNGNINGSTITGSTIISPTVTGGTIIGGRIQNATNTAYIDSNGNIRGVNITGSTLDAGSVYSAGYEVRASVMVRGVLSHGQYIPIPTGYTESQCSYGILSPIGIWIPDWGEDVATGYYVKTNRQIVAYKDTYDIVYGTYTGISNTYGNGQPLQVNYWLIGIR